MKKTIKWTWYSVEEAFGNSWEVTYCFETEQEALEYVNKTNKEFGSTVCRYAGPIEKQKTVEIDERPWYVQEEENAKKYGWHAFE